MAFLQLYNLAKIQNLKGAPKIAKVVNNNDPKKLGRVRVELEGMYEANDKEGSNLPWIPRIGSDFLSGTGSETFSVPHVGAAVQLIWPYDDKHAFYRGAPYGDINSTEAFTDNYPYQSGFKVGKLLIRFDEPTSSIEITNGTGFKIEADATGDVLISGGKVTIESDYDIDLKAQNVNIDGNLNVTGIMECAEGASGVIDLTKMASVSGGIITDIKA